MTCYRNLKSPCQPKGNRCQRYKLILNICFFQALTLDLAIFLKPQQLFLSQKGAHAKCQRIKCVFVIVEQQHGTGKEYTSRIKILNHSVVYRLQDHLQLQVLNFDILFFLGLNLFIQIYKFSIYANLTFFFCSSLNTVS